MPWPRALLRRGKFRHSDDLPEQRMFAPEIHGEALIVERRFDIAGMAEEQPFRNCLLEQETLASALQPVLVIAAFNFQNRAS